MKKKTFYKIINIFKKIGFVILFTVGVLSIQHWFTTNLWKKTTYLGTIIEKSSSAGDGKYIETTFLVDFQKIGKRGLNVSSTTFAEHKVGDSICWTFKDSNINGTETADWTKFALAYFYGAFFLIYVAFHAASEIYKFIHKFIDELDE